MHFDKDQMNNKSRWLFLLVFFILVNCCRNSQKVNHGELISANNIENSFIDSLNPFKVGNPEFIFAVDMTGMQTFPEYYRGNNSLGTLAAWTKSNPCRFNLGVVGLHILKKNGKEISVNDIAKPDQRLNIWNGEIESMFSVEDIPVHLKTVCHSDYDMISVKISSGLIQQGRLRIKIAFETADLPDDNSDHDTEMNDVTNIISDTNNITAINRIADKENYYILLWRNGAVLRQITKHLYYLEPESGDSVYSFSCQFMKDSADGRVQNFGETSAASKKSWGKFWNSLNENDFRKYSGPVDPELKKQAILLRYLSGISCSNFRRRLN